MESRGMRRKVALRIGARETGFSVLDLLAERFRYQSRSEWQRDIQAGRVRLNQAPVSAENRLSPGDVLSYHPPRNLEPKVHRDYEILYRDDAILVINKPGNLPCHPGGRYFSHTLWALLKEREGIENIHFVHRLDRETSGLVLVAADPESARICQTGFESGAVRKVYRALVEGDFPSAPLTAEGCLLPDADSPVRKKRRFVSTCGKTTIPDGAQRCRTRFRLVKRHGPMSLVEARPDTGRLHQIRATLLGMGYPVVGDKLYGVDDALFLKFIEDGLTPEDRARLRIDRQALHASELSFRHPRTGAEMSFRASIPDDMIRISNSIL